MSTEPRIPELEAALAGLLPGHSAHRTVLPEGLLPPVPGPDRAVRPAAVLLPLLLAGEGVSFPLIRRPVSMLRHGGQIGLPGGVLEAGEGNEAAALRESHEEIGLPPEKVRVLGALTPVFIPVTGYQVQPVVGWVEDAPPFQPAEAEVLEILMADPDDLALTGARAQVVRERDGRRWSFPAYEVAGEKVWGATAQILAEFLTLWGGLRRGA